MEIGDRISKYVTSKGITIAEFERISGLGNGYVRKIRNTVGRRKLEDILSAFPDLNRVWLLTGEGEMLNPSPSSISQRQNGGTGNTQSVTLGQSDMGRFIEELAAQRRMTEKAQEQIDRLLNLLEKK